MTVEHTNKTIHVPVELNEVVYVNIPHITIPARRIVTEIRVTRNGIWVTVENSRTGEQTVFEAQQFGHDVFTDSVTAMAKNPRYQERITKEVATHA